MLFGVIIIYMITRIRSWVAYTVFCLIWDQIWESIWQRNGLHQYIPGVHDKSAEEVRPGDVIHGILLGSNSSWGDLRIQVISKNTKQTKNKIIAYKNIK